MSRRAAPLVVVVLGVALVGAPAHALTDRWATWAPVEGTSNAFRTELRQQSAGFPRASVSSDSRSPVLLPSGASTFLGASTPPGAKYGSSAGTPYLVLRPRADNATAPSTTTYAFDDPTPDTGWAFVLGDVDADEVRVSATDARGDAVSTAEVSSWFAGSFNNAGGTDVPTWSATTSTLTGNASATDTDGASGWFEPDVRLSSLTLTFTRRAGFPVYQTWFVSRARPLGGTVSDVSTVGGCSVQQATLTLVSPFGRTLATATPAVDGSYSFGEHATQGDYVVRLDVPDGCAVVGPAQRTVSNRGADNSPASRADFTVREIIPQPISGTVRDAAGPVGGVVVTLTAPGGATTTTTTAVDGTYLFDNNAIGTGYTLTLTPPAGSVVGPDGTTISGIDVSTAPITGQDFLLVDLPSVTGTVTGGGQGLGGVQVVLTPTGGGTSYAVPTAGDGTYEIDGLPPGDYTLDVVAPPGYTPPPPRGISVPAGGLTAQDVALSRPGAVSGVITRDGAPVVGVEVVVDGPGGPRVLRADGEGQYYLDQLAPGTYVVTVRPPAGTVVVGAASLSVVITAAGEVRGGQDFALAAAPTPTPSPTPTQVPTTATPSPTATPTATPTSTPTPPEPTETPTSPEPTAVPTDPGDEEDQDDPVGSEVLPDTGGPSLWLAAGGAATVALGLGMVLVARRRPRDERP